MAKLHGLEKYERKICCCEDWMEYIAKLRFVSIPILENVKFVVGKIFKYCPWCGRKLKNEKKR